MGKLDSVTEKLKEYFLQKNNVAMAFLFGSFARSQHTADSDLDVAIYFYPKTNRLEWEEDYQYPEENIIWREVENIVCRETDLLVLNRAPATISYAVLYEDVPIIIKDNSLYWRFFLSISSAAEDFREFTRVYWAIKQRSKSLTDIDIDRLIHILDFMESELSDLPMFNSLTKNTYMSDSSTRRNVERWVENIVNASIDIAKIVLASEQKKIPQTYREILQNMELLEGFDSELAQKLSEFSKLRNVLAHEYLDIRYEQIDIFIQEMAPSYRKLFNFAKGMLKNFTM